MCVRRSVRVPFERVFLVTATACGGAGEGRTDALPGGSGRDPETSDDSGDGGGSDTAEAIDPKELAGVWNAHYPGGFVDYGSWRIEDTSSGWSASYSGEPATIAVADDPLSVQLTVALTGEWGGYPYTYDIDISLSDQPADDRLSGEGAYLFRRLDEDGNVFEEYAWTVPYEMGRVDRYDAVDSDGLTLLGASEPVGDGQLAVNVRVLGGLAYLARSTDGLRIYDVSDPAAISEVGHLAPTTRERWNDVKVVRSSDGARTFALVGAASSGMVAVDVTDPAAPAVVAQSPGGESDVHTLAVDGGVAYLGWVGDDGETDGGLITVDVSDPTAPVELARWSASEAGGSFVHDLYVADGMAYLCAWEAGLVLVDVDDPAAPSLVGVADYGESMTSHSVWVTDAPGRLVALEGGEDWDAHLRVIDVDPSSPSFLEVLGELPFRPQVSIHNIMMGAGTTAVIAWYQDGVRLVDVADPTAPSLAGWANTWSVEAPTDGQGFFEGAVGVDVVGDIVYVADAYDDLLAYRME